MITNYVQIYNELKSLLIFDGDGSENFVYNENGNGKFNIKIDNSIFINFPFKKNNVIEIRSRYKKDLEYKHISYSEQKNGFIRVEIPDINFIREYISIFQKMYDDIVSNKKDIACCSKYIECSDARRCVQPVEWIANRCYYRKNIRDGKIFYGKNSIVKES